MQKKMQMEVACVVLVAAVALPAGMSTASDGCQDTELEGRVYGSLTLLGVNRVGLGISNEGKVAARDISYTFTVAGGFDDSIYFTRADELDDIQPGYSVGVVWTRAVYGFGPLMVSMTAASSNAEDVSASAAGFQLGYFVVLLRG